jgi:hypothetical protein
MFVVAHVYLEGEAQQEIILLLIVRHNLKGQYYDIFSAPHLRSWSQQAFINDKFRNSQQQCTVQ